MDARKQKQIWAQWTKISVTVGLKWIYTDVFYAWILSITLSKSLCSQSANVNVTTFKLFWNYISKQTYTNVSSFFRQRKNCGQSYFCLYNYINTLISYFVDLHDSDCPGHKCGNAGPVIQGLAHGEVIDPQVSVMVLHGRVIAALGVTAGVTVFC